MAACSVQSQLASYLWNTTCEQGNRGSWKLKGGIFFLLRLRKKGHALPTAVRAALTISRGFSALFIFQNFLQDFEPRDPDHYRQQIATSKFFFFLAQLYRPRRNSIGEKLARPLKTNRKYKERTVTISNPLKAYLFYPRFENAKSRYKISAFLKNYYYRGDFLEVPFFSVATRIVRKNSSKHCGM